MRRPSKILETSLSDFRDRTSLPSDGRATRARVLAIVGRQRLRRAVGRRLSIFVGAFGLAILSASAAWTAIGRRESATGVTAMPAETRRSGARALPSPRSTISSTQTQSMPSLPLPPVAVPSPLVRETQDYGIAHRAHFVDQDPGAALVAWDRYLRRNPQGTFIPEARYNRALCLIKLQRFDVAAVALRPFATGKMGQYRQHEAKVLLDWIAQNAP